MEILQKIVDCKKVENSRGNLYDRVSFSKVINLPFSGCNFAMKRIHHRFFLENVPQTSCLKKKTKKSIFLRKKSIVDQRLNKAAALWYTTLNFIKKTELM